MRQDNENLLASVLTSWVSVCEIDRTYIHSFLHIIDFEYFAATDLHFFYCVSSLAACSVRLVAFQLVLCHHDQFLLRPINSQLLVWPIHSRSFKRIYIK